MNLVLRITAALCTLLTIAHAVEIPHQPDRANSENTKLDAATLRRIRAAAGIPENSDSLIKELDTRALAKRNQILLTEQFPGSGRCLAIHIIQNNPPKLKQVWKLMKAPRSGGGICAFLARTPTVRVSATGEIILAIPSAYINTPERREEYVYVWNGRTYVLNHHRSVDE